MRRKLVVVGFLLEGLLAIYAGMLWLMSGDLTEFLVMVVCLLCALVIALI